MNRRQMLRNIGGLGLGAIAVSALSAKARAEDPPPPQRERPVVQEAAVQERNVLTNIEFHNGRISSRTKYEVLRKWDGEANSRVTAFLPANTKAYITKYTNSEGRVTYGSPARGSSAGEVEYLSFWGEVQVAVLLDQSQFSFYMVPAEDSMTRVLHKYEGSFRNVPRQYEAAMARNYYSFKDLSDERRARVG